VTAGVAAPAYAGIPVTHRGLASEVTFITAHEDPRKKPSVNWKALAQLQGTLVLYMGIKTLPETVRLFLKYGKKSNTPISVIRWGTTGEQKTVTGTLQTIVRNIEKAKLTAPALTVIGNVNRLRSKIKWFEEKPLFGKTVLVTRSRQQASQLAEALEAEGARVIEVPTIEIAPIKDFRVLDRAIRRIAPPHPIPLPQGEGRVRGYDWLVFTSENGVEAFFNRFRALKKDARSLSHLKIAAIGPGTKAKLNSYSVEPDLIPSQFTTEGLLHAFRKVQISKKRFLLLRTNIAPDLLKISLEKAGAQVTEIPVYQTEKPEGLSRKVAEIVQQYPIDYITFTSSSTVKHFFEALRNGRHLGAKMISIGPVTSKTIRDFGVAVSREAQVQTISGLVEAVLKEESLSSPRTRGSSRLDSRFRGNDSKARYE
ncbi:MAG: uroporphyrinogen-III synthase, partial [Candidatus Omnitrophica bacterium]|nr:uroporphyrinogen-III synthase [Candidatus Omnitrophota bacterium]